jgi:hypothetical protein
MRREIKFFPAFDKTSPDPKKNYGVGCLELRFLVEGERGMVELQILTQWYLPHVMDRRLESFKRDVWSGKQDFLLKSFLHPNPIDLCYLSLERLSEDDSFWEHGVSYFRNNSPCYYGYKYMDDNKNIAKEDAFMKLVSEGDESLWKYLEDYYVEVFGGLK